MNDKVIDVVKKLLNKADPSRNSSIEEAKSALDIAHRLLRKHHLSMSHVLSLIEDDELSDSGANVFDIVETTAVTYKANVVPRWMSTLILCINNITQTKTLLKRVMSTGDKLFDLNIVFVGDSTDTETAGELFGHLKNSITKLSSTHCRETGGKFKQWRSFAEGCSETLLDRSKDLIAEDLKKFNNSKFDISNFELTDEDEYEILEEDETDDESNSESEEKSIQLYNQYKELKFEKIQDYIKEKAEENEKLSSASSRIDETSYDQGSRAGKKIPLKVAKLIKERSKKERKSPE